MKYSINWLQRYIDLSDQDPDQIADLITRRVAEIEGVEKIGVPETVVIGQILEIEKHPQADRLSVTVVDIGKKKLIIVCGAPNIKVGQKVPVALVGTKLPNGMLIESRAVRGIESNGMICAEDELGIGNDHSGIIVLDKKCQIGKKLKDELKLPADTIIEVENKNMTHRPDLFCHRGYARELAVIFNKKYEFPKTEKIKEGSTKLDITVENPQAVHAYMMVKIDNVKVEKSPSWLRDDLNKIGINSINNIVDATNWVMNDMGQPFHAFDAGKVQKIIVRQAKNNEKIFGLDGKEHSLTKDDIVIADEKKVLDLAGIIGGKESAISDSTTSIILESANFNSTMIRKTAQRLGLRTDAVTRFEKGLDPNLAEDGLNQLVALILKLSPKAKVSSKVFQEKNFEPVEKKVSFSLAKLENRIGYPLKLAGVKRILTILGFEVSQKKGSADDLEVIFPSFRATKDTGIFEDIVEEVARHIGYENIKPAKPNVPMTAPLRNREKEIQRKITQIMVGAGFNETHNYSFLDKITLNKCGFEDKDAVRVLNPLSRECEYLQPCMIPNMLGVIKKNEREFPDKLKFFTFDRRWEPKKNKYGIQYLERSEITEIKEFFAIMANEKNGYQIMKGLAEKIARSLEIFDLSFESQKYSGPIPIKKYVSIISNGIKIGTISEASVIAKNLDVKSEPVYAFKFYIKTLLEAVPEEQRKFKALPEFPAVKRDLAFTVDKKLLVGKLIEAIKTCSSLVESVEIFDIYEGEKIADSKKSVALSVSLRHAEKTLSDADIKSATDLILQAVSKVGGELRK